MRREQWSRHTIASCASKQADRTALLGTEAHRRHRTNAPRASKASLERRRGRLFAWIVHSGLAIFMRQTARERRGFQCVMAAVRLSRDSQAAQRIEIPDHVGDSCFGCPSVGQPAESCLASVR
jgi:hypothetical protein